MHRTPLNIPAGHGSNAEHRDLRISSGTCSPFNFIRRPLTSQWRTNHTSRYRPADICESTLSVRKMRGARVARVVVPYRFFAQRRRSEEHTSELQSPCNLVCRLLLDKKKQTLPSTQNNLQ